MGRKAEHQTLSVNIPTFFRCPISLDVMRSPVSLCTGVTYDRASITRWLDSGNTTCPATMQPLPSTDLVPNLTLHRLISLWASTTTTTATPGLPIDLLRDIRSSVDPIPALRRLAGFFSDPDIDDFAKNSLIPGSAGCAATLAGVITNSTSTIEIQEATFEILAQILTAEYIDNDNKQMIGAALLLHLEQSVSGIVNVLKIGRVDSQIVNVLKIDRFDSQTAAAKVLNTMLVSASPEAASKISEQPDLIRELIRLTGVDSAAVDPGLACLAALLPVRRARVRMVSLGIVPALVRVMETETVSTAAAERALRLMEAAAGCAEGREAICEDAERCVGVLMEWMMKVGKEGTEAAVMVLWSACHLYRDRRAIEAVTAGVGGMTKFLLLMQSYVSPATRQKASDLMKIFRVNTKSCLSGYDTKTRHIMPF